MRKILDFQRFSHFQGVKVKKYWIYGGEGRITGQEGKKVHFVIFFSILQLFKLKTIGPQRSHSPMIFGKKFHEQTEFSDIEPDSYENSTTLVFQ